MVIPALLSLLFVLEPEVLVTDAKLPAAVVEDLPPKVELISTGEAPRESLRLALKPGDVQSVVMEMDMQMKMALGGEERPSPVMPVFAMNAAVVVDEPLPAGGWKYHFDFTSVDVQAKEKTPPEMATMMKSMIGEMVGMRISAEIDPLGRQRHFEIVSKITNPMLFQQLESMKQSMSQMAVVLPDDEIGAGGEWVVESKSKAGGVATRQRAKYRLVSRDGSVIKLAISMHQAAAEKNSPIENLPAGATGTLIGLESDAKGEVESDLTRILPLHGRIVGESVANMDIEMQGVKSKIDSHTAIVMTIRPGAPVAKPAP
ncbi:MAG: hypothetical protein ACREJD_07360 [Phycisphaerales bacterium]